MYNQRKQTILLVVPGIWTALINIYVLPKSRLSSDPPSLPVLSPNPRARSGYPRQMGNHRETESRCDVKAEPIPQSSNCKRAYASLS